MANETLSAKEANKIIEEANKIMSLCQKRMEEKNNQFVDKLSKIWEDKNAVEYIKMHKKNFEGFIDELSGNNRIFAERVKDIADAYIKAGGMAVAITAAPIALTANFVVDAVKEFFSNGENADDFGFKDPSAGASQVMDAFSELKQGLEKAASDAISQIKSINAFGNVNVQLNLAQSSGAIVNILNQHVDAAEKQIRDLVDQTAQGYIKIGSNSEAAAKISSN